MKGCFGSDPVKLVMSDSKHSSTLTRVEYLPLATNVSVFVHLMLRVDGANLACNRWFQQQRIRNEINHSFYPICHGANSNVEEVSSRRVRCRRVMWARVFLGYVCFLSFSRINKCIPLETWRNHFHRESWLSQGRHNARGNELNPAYQLDLRVIHPKHLMQPLRFVRLDHLNVLIKMSSMIDTYWIKVTFMPFSSSTKRYWRVSRCDL